VGWISIPTVEALPTTEPPEYIWLPSTAWLLSAVDWWKRKKKRKFVCEDFSDDSSDENSVRPAVSLPVRLSVCHTRELW